MEAFPFRFRLHSSKRALASSSVIDPVLLRGMAFLLAGCPAAERPYQLCGAELMQPCRKLTQHPARPTVDIITLPALKRLNDEGMLL
jgi:hypothetical protein